MSAFFESATCWMWRGARVGGGSSRRVTIREDDRIRYRVAKQRDPYLGDAFQPEHAFRGEREQGVVPGGGLVPHRVPHHRRRGHRERAFAK